MEETLSNPDRRRPGAKAAAPLEIVPPAVDARPTPQRLAELRSMPYRRYLRSPEWRRARAAALHRAGNQCAFDATHGDELEVHHRTYERLGEELSSDLLVLCKECHRLHHAHHGRPRRAATKSKRAARRKAKREAAVRDLVFRLCLTAGLLAGLLGMLDR